MSYKVWEKGMQASAILLNFLAFFCVETAIFSVFPTLEEGMEEINLVQPGLIRQLCLILVPFLFWIIREVTKYFWLFVGMHGVVAAAAVLLLGETAMQKLVFGVFTAGYLVNSFRIRLTGGEMEDGHENLKGKGMEEKPIGAVLCAILAFVSYLVCVQVGSDTGCRRIWNTALLFSFLFFLDVYMQNLDRFIQFNRSSNSHIPVKGMLVRGGSLTLGFGLIAVAVLAAGTDNEMTHRITEIVKEAGLWVIRMVGTVIRFVLSLFESEGEAVADAGAGTMAPMEMAVGEAAESPLWIEILSKIFSLALLLGVFIVLCYLIYQVIMSAIRRFYSRKDSGQEKEGQLIEIRENLKRERDKKKQEKALPFFAGTPEERIRRSFVRTVRKTEKFRNPDGRAGGSKGKDIWRREAQEKLLKGLTARQIGDVTGLTGQSDEPKTGWLGIDLSDSTSAENQEEALELIRLYEKARYGKGSTPEEARLAEQKAAKLNRK